MKKKKIKYIVSEIILMVIFLYLVNKELININILDKNHFNLITVNSIFAGFLFSALALIVGLFNDKVLIRLERANFLDDIYRKIINGIINSVISIVLSLYNIFIASKVMSIIPNKFLIARRIMTYMQSLELFFLIATVVFFILGVRDIRFIIKSVRERVRSELPKNEALDRVIGKIKESQEK